MSNCNLKYDRSGKIVAVEGLNNLPNPWTVLLSKKHEGRCFFYNFRTNESCWSLDPTILGLPSSFVTEEAKPPTSQLPPIGKIMRLPPLQHDSRSTGEEMDTSSLSTCSAPCNQLQPLPCDMMMNFSATTNGSPTIFSNPSTDFDAKKVRFQKRHT
jgi:hypothetical protein